MCAAKWARQASRSPFGAMTDDKALEKIFDQMGSDLLSTVSDKGCMCGKAILSNTDKYRHSRWMDGSKKVALLEEDFSNCETDDKVWAEMGPKHIVFSWQEWILHL